MGKEEARARGARGAGPSAQTASHRKLVTVLALALLVAAWVRWDGLGDRNLGHPENFVPGLDVPDWVRFPPPRHDLAGVLRGTLIDGHPPGYFVLMLGWVRVAGTSLEAIRLPSVLAGVLSVGLLFLLVRRIAGSRAGLVAASLLAVHGFHVYWSQLARMYVPTSCLGLLSTWLLLRARGSRRVLDHLAYAAATTLALWMQMYAWPLLLGQIVYVLADALRNGRPARPLNAQGLAILLGLPVIQLAVFQNPPTRWFESPLGWGELGYLFAERIPRLEPAGDVTASLRVVALIAGLVVLVVAFARGASGPELTGEEDGGYTQAEEPVGRRSILGAALIACAAMVAFPSVVWGPIPARLGLGCLAVLPLIGALALRPIRARIDPGAASGVGRGLPRLGLAPCLVVVPAGAMLLISTVRAAFVARGTIVFLPYFVACAALAVDAAWRWKRIAGLGALVLLLGLHAASLGYFRSALASPRDYRGLADRIAVDLGPDDRILVLQNFIYPPLFHYLDAPDAAWIHEDHVAAVDEAPGRVFLVRFDDNALPDDVVAAVEGWRLVERREVRGGAAEVYERPSGTR